MKYQHLPVMLAEVLKALKPQAGQKFIDCTLGGAGYTLVLAEKVGDEGEVLGIDLDSLAIKNAKKIIKQEGLKNIKLIEGNFSELATLIPKQFKKVDGIVLDLGLSSAQLDDPRRGFSFLKEAPLNMAFGDKIKEDTGVIINKYRAEDLTRIIKDYGEERFAKNIAQAIITARPIKTSAELLEAIDRGMPSANKRQSKIHWATRTFQALRIATNDELANLEKVLPQALNLLKTGGKLVVVSFHSLEDRIVKTFLKSEAKGCHCPPKLPICVCGHQPRLKILTPKPIIAGEDELKNNPRARSAKLRIAIKL